MIVYTLVKGRSIHIGIGDISCRQHLNNGWSMYAELFGASRPRCESSSNYTNAVVSKWQKHAYTLYIYAKTNSTKTRIKNQNLKYSTGDIVLTLSIPSYIFVPGIFQSWKSGPGMPYNKELIAGAWLLSKIIVKIYVNKQRFSRMVSEVWKSFLTNMDFNIDIFLET